MCMYFDNNMNGQLTAVKGCLTAASRILLNGDSSITPSGCSPENTWNLSYHLLTVSLSASEFYDQVADYFLTYQGHLIIKPCHLMIMATVSYDDII